jgi:hypothetical protein
VASPSEAQIRAEERAATLERILERTFPADERTLDQRMAAVQAELEDVPRRGHADVTTKGGAKYSYDYILEADLMKAVRPLLAQHGIAVYYRDEILRYDQGTATVRVILTLRANGEAVVLEADGYAADTGDKAANKAKTNAVRYLLWKTFLQPSDEDPEQESTSAEQAAQADRARSGSSRRREPQVTRGRVIERIGHLALELDELQGKGPGATLSELPKLAKDATGKKYPSDVADDDLVRIGQALAQHVAGERARKESEGDGYVPADLTLA